MNIDINGFGMALLEYKRKDHTGMSKEQIKTDLQAIFDEFGVNATNFFSIKMKTDPKNEASIIPFIDKMAEGIIKNELLKKQWREAVMKNKDIPEEEKESILKQNSNKPRSKKPEDLLRKRPMCFNISEVGDLPLVSARGYMEKRLRMRGFSSEEMNQPLEQLSVLGTDDRAMNLNISPDENIVNQLVEMSKKLYLVFVKNIPVQEVRNMTLTTLLTNAKDDDSSFNFSTNGKQFKGEVDTDEPDIEVSVGANGNKGANVENDILDEKDKQEIEMYGLEGIATHSEMEDFRESAEYELLQSLQENNLSKSDDIIE